MLHESLDALRAIADYDVPHSVAQQLVNDLNDVIGKVRGHDPAGAISELVDAVNAFEGAINLTNEALAAMNTGAEHLYTAANG